MRRKWLFRLVAIVLSAGFAFGVGEAVVRLKGGFDEDGTFLYQGRKLRPIRPPAEYCRRLIEQYQDTPNRYRAYDRELGWTVAPNGRARGGMYVSNAQGIRTTDAAVTFAAKPAEGVFRIVVIGDSFAHGDGVPFEETWGHHLETGLKADGVETEMLNFAAGGYGMDQALLRWKRDAAAFHPHVVVFGFQPENMQRNVNLIRCFVEWNTGVPFSKPRYVLEGGRLRLINAPTVALREMPGVVGAIDTWEFVEHETFYLQEHFEDHWYLASKLVALWLQPPAESYAERTTSTPTEREELALAIIAEMERDVTASGARFMVVHLPFLHDLQAIVDRGEETLHYQRVLDELGRRYTLVDPAPAMIEHARANGLDSVCPGHYSAKGNQIVAEALVRELLKR